MGQSEGIEIIFIIFMAIGAIMLLIIYFLDKISKEIAFLTEYLMPVIIPVCFVIMAGFQGYKVFKKYFSAKIDLEQSESE